MDPDAPPRWDLVHARAVAALAEIFAHRRDAQKIVRKALRPEWFGPEGAPETPGWAGDARGGGVNNAERAAIADAVLGVEVLRLNLAYLVLERSRSAYEDTLRAAGGPDAFGTRALRAILHEQGVSSVSTSSPSSPPPAPDRAAYRAAAAAMLALYWMTHRVVSNEFARDYLAVLRGGAKLTGDDRPADPDDAFAVEASVPRWLAARLRAKFGDEDARRLCAEMRRRAPVTIRRNARLCASAGDLRDALDAEGVATATLEAAALTEHLAAAAADASRARNAAAASPGTTETGTESPSPSSPNPSSPNPPCAGAPDALVLSEGRPRAGVFGLATYRAGWFEVQDAGSQCIASAVADAVLDAAAAERAAGKPARLWKVLDLCAGNGGKALAVASRLAGARDGDDARFRGDDAFEFEVHCFDVDERRLRHLRAATERAGCVETVSTRTALDLRAVAHLGGGYDAVLADAPCSSTGALRRFPSLRWEIDERKTLGDGDGDGDEEIAWGWGGDGSGDGSGDERFDGDVDPSASDRANATPWRRAQRRILARAAALTRPGGALVYATCSILDAENAENARWFERWVPTSRREANEDDENAPAFAPAPFPRGWPAAPPESDNDDEHGDASHEAALLPHVHGTDGFYIARWTRVR